MQHTLSEICDSISDLVLEVSKDEISIASICSVQDYSEDSLIFVSEQIELRTNAAVIVTDLPLSNVMRKFSKGIIVVNNVRLAQARIKQAFFDFKSFDSEWDDVHSTATIHPSVDLASGVKIGPNSVIGEGVKLGKGVILRANCVVEAGVVIGEGSVLHHNVTIGYGTRIGKEVIVRPGAVIGNEGFGFAQDGDGRYHRIPHTGIVEIGDHVQIGSNSNIDRGTYGVTRIASGVKIDALCHIAHNVNVGEDALFVAQCGVAGSSNIGKRTILSGQTGVLDHKTIVDDAILVHRCGVTSDILEPGIWAGTPPKPFKEYVQSVSLVKRISQLVKRVKQLETKLKQP